MITAAQNAPTTCDPRKATRSVLPWLLTPHSRRRLARLRRPCLTLVTIGVAEFPMFKCAS